MYEKYQLNLKSIDFLKNNFYLVYFFIGPTWSLSDDEIEQFDTISEETLVQPKKIISGSTEIKKEPIVPSFEEKSKSDVQSSRDKNSFDVEPSGEKIGSQIQPLKSNIDRVMKILRLYDYFVAKPIICL